ncbi:polymer-forming cytoskeletal protein [Sphaerotilus montanus]|uniref:Cytoskeletal protein CcmA (Bactofilin family) n=1 Tax=Sphaerotilus montanus TaxID=522889 RepID=A0A7Y9QWZ4_9BURK|nr:polymer-forming cytoskeletal protein [Sphaerotilus montanus]NYG31554.1 cytoskeletal protein CcmA (bactofilin family) [Sphaerotilus montanus]NZD57933.1 polymer-forming cytoskeletal protein [Sphaerotilus montanus]
MWKQLGAGLSCVVALLVVAAEPPGDGDPPLVVEQDVFIGGGTVTVRQPVNGDLIVSGGSVDLDAPVAGDMLAVGGKLRLGADTARSVHAAGGQLSLDARVGRHARVAGGQVELGPKAEIGGNLSVAGGRVRLYGQVRGQVHSAGGQLLIDGPVGGDVVALHARIELGPNARIAGQLRYRSEEPLVQDPAAQVAGGIEKLPVRVRPGDRRAAEPRPDWSGGMGVFGALWTLGHLLLASVLLAVLPSFSATLARTLRERPGASLLLGFAWLVGLPMAVVLLCLTLVGIPLGLVALAAYAALMPLAWAITATAVGDWALRRWWPDQSECLPVRIGASAVVLVLMYLVGWVPGLGAAIGVLGLIAGLGCLLLQAWPRSASPPAELASNPS